MQRSDLHHSDLTWLAGVARALTRDGHGAEDIAQETAAAALEGKMPQGPARRAWLSSVARNIAARHARTDIRRKDREALTAAATESPDTAELVERAEIAEKILSAVRRLEEPFRRTLLLRFMEGLDPRAIADRDGIPADTVRWRVRRGLTLTKKELLQEGERSWSGWCIALGPLARQPLPVETAAIGTSGALVAPILTGVIMKVGALICAVVLGIGLYLAQDKEPLSSSRMDTLPNGQVPQDASELRGAELVPPASSDHPRQAAIQLAGQPAPNPTPSLTLRIGPRPEGTRTARGQLLMRPRRASDEDDAPEWYLQEQVLAVSLSGRGGGGVRPADFDGQSDSALEPLTLTWNDLPPDTYELLVELRGHAGSSQTRLTEIVVTKNDTEQDPRLTAWDPMLDFDVMRLFLEVPAERKAEKFIIGISEGPEGRALLHDRRLLSAENDTEIHGPFYIVHHHGHSALVHAFDEWGGEVILPFGTQDQTMSLPSRLFGKVVAAESPGGLNQDDVGDIYLKRVAPVGEWRLPIPTTFISTYALPGPGYAIPISVPAEGSYRFVADERDWSTAPCEMTRDGKNTVAIEVANLR